LSCGACTCPSGDSPCVYLLAAREQVTLLQAYFTAVTWLLCPADTNTAWFLCCHGAHPEGRSGATHLESTAGSTERVPIPRRLRRLEDGRGLV
jgi:hypothetical protein